MISACSPKTEISFGPSTGDERTYWTYSDVSMSGSLGDNKTTMLEHYKVTNTDPLSLDVSVDYINLHADGEAVINSAKLYNIKDSNKALIALFKQGFTLSIDPGSGQLIDFQGNDKATWQKILERGGQQAVNMFKNNTLTPGVILTIPAKVGAQISLPNFAGQPVSLEVIKVTDEKIYTRITSDKTAKTAQIMAEMILNREDGWLEKLVLVAKQSISRFGREHNIQTRLVMLPKEHPTLFDYNYSEGESSWHKYRYVLNEGEFTKAAKGNELFPFDEGVFQNNATVGLELSIPLQLTNKEDRGIIKSRDIEVFDKEDNLMDIELAYSHTKIPYYDESISKHALTMIGWNNQADQKEIDHVNATVDYYPVQHYSKTVDWAGKAQSFSIHGMKVTVTPTKNNPSIITVSSQPTNERQYLKTYLGGADDIQMRYGNGSASQAWLNLGDKIMLRRLTMLKDAQSVQFKLSTIPKHITFYLSETAEEPTLSKPMKFVKTSQYINDPKKPPLDQLKLKFFTSNISQDVTTLSDFEIAPANHAYDYVLLPSDWATICQLSVIGDNKVDGHSLEWLAEDEDSYNQLGGTYYNLSTDDNKEQFFKNLSVTSQLQCEGTPSWQTINYQANVKTPWLVSLKTLGNVNTQQTVAEFISHYRFLNKHAEPLVVVTPDRSFINNPKTTLLKDIILPDEHAINIAGKVKSIKKLVIRGQPQTRKWTHNYPKH